MGFLSFLTRKSEPAPAKGAPDPMQTAASAPIVNPHVNGYLAELSHATKGLHVEVAPAANDAQPPAVSHESAIQTPLVDQSTAAEQAEVTAAETAKPVAPGTLSFTCNICGHHNYLPLMQVAEREQSSCEGCLGSLRFRSIILAIQQRLLGDQNTPLAQIEPRKDLSGIGMSDAYIYADVLKEKFNYINSYYHMEPFLDITAPAAHYIEQFDFIVTSDVMEHVAPPVQDAFVNLRRLLKPNGVLAMSVPFTGHPVDTVEHFPDLYDYHITGEGSERVLHNTTNDGRTQEFTDLCFHGGDGSTLEMRLFSERGLIQTLTDAGFTQIKVHREHYPEIGIINFAQYSLIVSAINPQDATTEPAST